MAQMGALSLLLWAGVIALGSCQSTADPGSLPSQPPPSSTDSNTASQVINSDNNSTGSQSPASNNSTPTPSTATTTATTTTDPYKNDPCEFKVEPVKYGLRIELETPNNKTFNVTVLEEDQVVIQEQFNSSIHNITPLKPCTAYMVKVQRASGLNCTGSDNKITTEHMKKEDLTYAPRPVKMISFNTKWNITCSDVSALGAQAQPCPGAPQTCCIKVTNNNLCSDLSITFNNTNCLFTDTISLTAEKFLSAADLTQKVIYNNPKKTNGHPAKIEFETPLPKICKLTTEYNCEDTKKNTMLLSKLEPFKTYTCIGNIKNETAVINKTDPVKVNTFCDITSSVKPQTSTNTSITLEWETKTENCNLTVLKPKLEYTCTCTSRFTDRWPRKSFKETSSVETCIVNGLEAFITYDCKIQTLYEGNELKEHKQTVETKPGIPGYLGKLMVYLTENNGFHVNCSGIDHFRGPEGKYEAILKLKEKIINRLENKKKCHFEFKNLDYSTTYLVEVKAVNIKHAGRSSSKTVQTSFNDKALIGFLVFLILLTSVALMVVLYKIYILKQRNSRNRTDDYPLLINEEERLQNVEPIQAEVLLDTYKRKLADEGRLFLAEFQSVPRIFSKFTIKEAKKNCNAIKNRYVDILPYDYNRVQLTTGNGEQGCDYINASFIDGYKEAKKYIAAQGPKEETITDFWRMVWEQKSSVIVMVTRCEEGNRPKCAQYWPSLEREAEIFEEFVVKVNAEDQCPDYTIRHLSLTNKREKNSEREVTHIQFLSWPDHGVPGEPHLLLKLRRRVNAFKNLFSGPIVVHCSAGVGRTGTYIGIDAMMEGLEAEGRVDIYGYVVQLRRQRCLMVQVEAQYILIHQALLEHNQFGETEVSLSELHSTLSTLKEQGPGEEGTLLADEFERMPVYKNWRTYNAGITEENKKKNRVSAVVPYDYNRVLLRLEEELSRDSQHDEDEEDESSDEEEESSKYINATHVDGYWGSRCFITAQTPVSDTTADFWLMVHQKKVSSVIMLSEEDKECVYWPKEKTTYVDVEVEVTSTEITPVFVSRTINIRHVKRKEGRAVRHFQFLKWGEGELPEKPQDLMDMLKEVRSKCGDSKTLRVSPALVHCNDGSSRSGLLVALWNLLDSANTEKLVDVFQVVKTLRKERGNMISTLEQYQFLYDMLEATFPVQNGDLKAPPASAANSVEIIDETKTAEPKASEQESAATATDQEKEPLTDKQEPTEEKPGEDTSTSPLVTAEV
ncbi:hypothetical protein NL108_013105 [Boleophthalmus pectinirostris]|nr:hypothetical protein NL108_013105 [Boleophthalmus pectinirostris]